MNKKTISVAAVFSLVFFSGAFAAGPSDFAELERMTASSVPAPEGQDLPKYGVHYALTGVLTLDGGGALLNTPDGRLFRLDVKEGRAAEFNGRTVRVRARGMQADDLDTLKVDAIELYDPAMHELSLPPRQPKRRAARVLSEDRDGITVENVRWLYDAVPSNDKFDWATAKVRPELLKKVYFIKKPFPPEWLAAHSLFVFTFGEGGLTDGRGNSASGLALSVEAFLREGESYDLKAGLKERFGIVWLLTTWEDYAARSAHNDKARLVPYEVNLTGTQGAAMLREALRLASVNREGEYYHTVTNNCTNNLLILLNRVLPEDRRIRLWTIPYMVYNVYATMPVMVPEYLQRRGLLGPELAPVNLSNYLQSLP